MRRTLAATGFFMISSLGLAAEYGKEFWSRWGDGKAEMAGYELSFRRYGDLRQGSAVAIFVTEPFLKAERVKSDRAEGSNVVNALKLNLVRDFPTGIYDYNLMTSVFVTLDPADGLPAGRAAKVSFSSQEWCGHVYHQALFHPRSVDESWNSYFEGEADGRRRIAAPFDGFSEDALFHWARGLAEPLLAPGEERHTSIFSSLAYARLNHAPAAWERALLERAAEPVAWKGPSGTRKALVCRAHVAGSRLWTFHVEPDGDRRILEWTVEDMTRGTPVLLERGRFLRSERLPYWTMQREGDRQAVRRMGLSPRGTLSP